MFLALWLWLCATPPAHAAIEEWQQQIIWHSRYRAVHSLFLSSEAARHPRLRGD